MSDSQRPFSQHLSDEIARAGQLGSFEPTMRELQGERTLVAGPETAARLRSAYDLDVESSVTLAEGEIYVFDDKAISKAISEALDGPFIAEPTGAPMPWELPSRTARDAIIITGVS